MPSRLQTSHRTRVHGGAIVSLCDSVFWVALASLYGPSQPTATASLTCAFLCPALPPHDLLAKAAVLKPGKRIVYGEVQNPIFLFLRIGNRETASGGNGCQGRFCRPSQMDQRAGRRDGGPADASPAMHADVLAVAKAICQPSHEGSEGGCVRRNMNVWNGEGEEPQSISYCDGAFFGQFEQPGFVLFESETSVSTPPLFSRTSSSCSSIFSVRPQHDCQGCGRIALNPKNVAHSVLRPPQTARCAGGRWVGRAPEPIRPRSAESTYRTPGLSARR